MEGDSSSQFKDFGPYSLHRELGRGGQATVWLAEDHKLRRRVALKVFHSGPATGSVTDQELARFRREAEAASKLDHPNICTLLDVGDVDGAPFLAFRYIEGETLMARIERVATARRGESTTDFASDSDPSSKQGIQSILTIFEKIARALHKAHEKGLIHRDIKPGNIMLTDEAEPVILDFGLARDEFSGDEMSLTHSGDLIGTPAYMSPEQLMAQRIPVDRRTDVYSMGATLYESLTLNRPFEALTRAELYQRIMTDEPTSAYSLNRAIPRDLQVVLETALEKNRDRRYQTSLAFGEDLRRVREFEPIQAKPVGQLVRVNRWAQRHPAIATSAASLFLLITTALVISLSILRRLDHEKDRARAMGLAAASAQARPDNPLLALKLAVVAVSVEETAATLSQVANALANLVERVTITLDSEATALDLNQDKGLILTGTTNGSVRLWNLHGERVGELLPHRGGVQYAGFRSDGKRILTASADGTVGVWRLDGTLETAPVQGGDPISGATWSPDGKWFVITRGASATVWSVTGDQLGKVEGYVELRADDMKTSPAVFTESGDLMLTASTGGRITVRNRKSEPIITKTFRPEVSIARFSPDGLHALIGWADGSLDLWEIRSGRTVSLRGHRLGVMSLAFSPDAGSLLTAAGDMSIRTWSSEGEPMGVIARHSGHPRGAEFYDERMILTWSDDTTARLWSRSGRPALPMIGHRAGVFFACASPNRGLVVTASEDRTVRIWEVRGVEDTILRGHEGRVEVVLPGTDEGIVTGGRDGLICFWTRKRESRGQLETGLEIASMALHDEWIAVGTTRGRVLLMDQSGNRSWHEEVSQAAVWGLAFTEDGSVVCQSENGSVQILNSTTGASTTIYEGSSRIVSISRDKRTIAVGTSHGSVILMDSRGRRVGEFTDHRTGVRTVAFGPHGNLLAMGTERGTASVRNLITGDTIALRGHNASITAIVISQDGNYILTVSKDGTARLWGTDGQELLSLTEPMGGQYRDACFTSDGHWIATASSEGFVRLWPINKKELLRIAHERLDGRILSAEEWKEFEDLLGK